MEFVIKMTNKVFYSFVAVVVCLFVGVGVYAFTDDNSGIPSEMGHSSDEILVEIGGELLGLQSAISGGRIVSDVEVEDIVAGVVYDVIGDLENRLSSLETDIRAMPSPYLINSKHTEKQCEDSSGVVVTESGATFCKFDNVDTQDSEDHVSLCPVGWTRYNGWGEARWRS